MTMNLYTIVFEFRGGTYIGQAASISPKEATVSWAKTITQSQLSEWKLDKERFIERVYAGDVTDVAGCIGVWCLSETINGHLALINVIHTHR
jgi:hypothetical protein